MKLDIRRNAGDTAAVVCLRRHDTCGKGAVSVGILIICKPVLVKIRSADIGGFYVFVFYIDAGVHEAYLYTTAGQILSICFICVDRLQVPLIVGVIGIVGHNRIVGERVPICGLILSLIFSEELHQIVWLDILHQFFRDITSFFQTVHYDEAAFRTAVPTAKCIQTLLRYLVFQFDDISIIFQIGRLVPGQRVCVWDHHA